MLTSVQCSMQYIILFPFEKVVFPFCVNRNTIHCTFIHPRKPFSIPNVKCYSCFFCHFQQLIYKFLVSVRLYIFKGKRENAKTFALRYVWWWQKDSLLEIQSISKRKFPFSYFFCTLPASLTLFKSVAFKAASPIILRKLSCLLIAWSVKVS